MAEAVTPEFLARQQERMLEEMGRQRDDMTMLLAVVQRLDGTMQGLVNEARALHGQHARLSRRIDRLEPSAPGG